LVLDAQGMLIYTVIVSPGYFARKGVLPLLALFAVWLAVPFMRSIGPWCKQIAI
jgi:hypothetical protein